MRSSGRALVTATAAAVWLAACAAEAPATGETTLPAAPDWMVPDGRAHFDMRVAEIAALPELDDETLLLGDSITEAWKWQDVQPGPRALNHGVGWDVAEGLLARWPQYADTDPARIHIMIGTNDLSYQRPPEQIVPSVQTLVRQLKARNPDARIILQSVLPREASIRFQVDQLNARYKALAAAEGLEWLDLSDAFSDAEGKLRSELTDDDLHLNAKGYRLWSEQVRIHDMANER